MRLGQLQGGSVVFQRRATLDFGADGWQAGTAFTFVQNTIVQVPQTNNTHLDSHHARTLLHLAYCQGLRKTSRRLHRANHLVQDTPR